MARKRRDPPSSSNAGLEPDKAHIDACRRCELWQPATQGVAGEGASDAKLLLVGEQPGNDEDLAGRPFVGPAGKLLREVLAAACIAPDAIFLTNAVKHFRYELRGKRRLHKTPLQRHVAACHAWLESEIARVAPAAIVTLGATALRAVSGRRLSLAAAQAEAPVHDASGTPIVATLHPSAILRAPDATTRATLRARLLADLRRAAELASRRRRQ